MQTFIAAVVVFVAGLPALTLPGVCAGIFNGVRSGAAREIWLASGLLAGALALAALSRGKRGRFL